MFRLLIGVLLAGSSCLQAVAEIPAWVAELEQATPTEAKKLSVPKTDAALRAKWAKWVKDYAALPVDQVRANPAAAAFPGEVKPGAAPMKDFRFAVDLNLPRWQFTGLYAAAGEKVVVTLPADAVEKGLSIRIGCHTDNITPREKWSRFPSISRSAPLKAVTTEIANPFGGLIYIEVPRDKGRGGVNVKTYGGYIWLDENVKSAMPASVELRISGGVAAPSYKHGSTTPEQWSAQLAATSAPWGEMAGKRFIFSLPIAILRTVKDPAAVMLYWDKVLDEAWKFGGWRGERHVAERFVPDVMISAGYLHSGYPFMGHYNHAKEVVDLETLKTKGNWGFFHELGHNHEGQAYTFGSEFVEVVVNLHTLYLMKAMCGLDPRASRSAWKVDAELKSALDGKRDPFALLTLYVPLIEAFGFESLTKTFQTYWAKDGMEGVGADVPSKVDAFVLRYSTTVGRDCSEYFAKFNLTCTEATKQKLSTLPKFMPAGLVEAPVK